MGAFETILQYGGLPLAGGFAEGIDEDRIRRRNIADKVEAYKSLVEPQLGVYERQKQIDRQYNQKPPYMPIPKGTRYLMGPDGRMIDLGEQQAPANDIASLFGRNVEVPQDPSVMPAKPGSANYGAGEEASSGVIPPTKTAKGNDLMARLYGLNPQEYQPIPHVSAKGETSFGFQRVPRDPAVSTSALTNPYGIARAAVGLAPGQLPDPEQAMQIYKIVERHAKQKGISPRAQVFNDVMETTGDIRQAEYAAAIFEESLAKASGAGRTIGQNTGEALQAKVGAAGQVGQASAEGGIRGKLSPVPVPTVPGQPALPPMPGASAVVASQQQAKNITEPLQGADRSKYQMLSAASRQTDYVKNLYRPEFVGKGFAPFVQGVQKEFANQEQAAIKGQYTPGALAGAVRQFFGNISQEEATFRKAVLDVSDMILRARSGAQINEQEYRRMKGLLYNLTDEPSVFVAGLNRFSDEVNSMMEDVSKASVRPASSLGTGPLSPRPQGPATTPQRKHQLSGSKTGKPDGTYKLQDGSTVTVKGGVIQ